MIDGARAGAVRVGESGGLKAVGALLVKDDEDTLELKDGLGAVENDVGESDTDGFANI